MGKRKSRTVQAKGPVAKVATVFDCPYCSRRETVEIKIAKKEGVGKLFCRVCSVGYQMRLGPLTKPVDIYCEWIDNADKLNQKQKSLGLQEVQLKHEHVDTSEDEDDVSALQAGQKEFHSAKYNPESKQTSLGSALVQPKLQLRKDHEADEESDVSDDLF